MIRLWRGASKTGCALGAAGHRSPAAAPEGQENTFPVCSVSVGNGEGVPMDGWQHHLPGVPVPGGMRTRWGDVAMPG